MLNRDVLEIADRWWARGFGRQPDELRPEVTHVQAHAGTMEGATGIWILVVDCAPLVSLPAGAMVLLADRARRWSRALVADSSALAMAVSPLKVERIVGPAYIGYGTAETLTLPLASDCRELTAKDDAAVVKLRAACSDEEWDHGGSDHHGVPTFGSFNERGDLLAMAGYRTWAEKIAHISIVTAQGNRGRGLASAAVASAARHAIDAGLLPQYRTLASNQPSVGVARRLGFEAYGFSVFVRLCLG